MTWLLSVGILVCPVLVFTPQIPPVAVMAWFCSWTCLVTLDVWHFGDLVVSLWVYFPSTAWQFVWFNVGLLFVVFFCLFRVWARGSWTHQTKYQLKFVFFHEGFKESFQTTTATFNRVKQVFWNLLLRVWNYHTFSNTSLFFNYSKITFRKNTLSENGI